MYARCSLCICVHVCVYNVYVYIYIYMYISHIDIDVYIYIYIERERDTYIYIYVYMLTVFKKLLTRFVFPAARCMRADHTFVIFVYVSGRPSLVCTHASAGASSHSMQTT